MLRAPELGPGERDDERPSDEEGPRSALPRLLAAAPPDTDDAAELAAVVPAALLSLLPPLLPGRVVADAY